MGADGIRDRGGGRRPRPRAGGRSQSRCASAEPIGEHLLQVALVLLFAVLTVLVWSSLVSFYAFGR